MKLIIISGPSGSGKTTLSKIILKKLRGGIILSTDNYYKTGILSQILSKTVSCYFDRFISFNYKEFKKDLEFILKNRLSNFNYKYNFKTKSSEKTYKITKNIKFIIVEGIFGQEILKSLSNNDSILIYLKTSKECCMQRVINRDFKERGKSKNKAKIDFIKAWELFDKYQKKNYSKNYLKKIEIRNISEMDFLLENINNLVN